MLKIYNLRKRKLPEPTSKKLKIRKTINDNKLKLEVKLDLKNELKVKNEIVSDVKCVIVYSSMSRIKKSEKMDLSQTTQNEVLSECNGSIVELNRKSVKKDRCDKKKIRFNQTELYTDEKYSSDNISALKQCTRAHNRFKCQYCNKLFKGEKKRDLHHNAHIKKQNFPCENCDETFEYFVQLAVHISIVHKHHDPSRTECPICKKMVSAINAHLRTHSNKPQKCEICDAVLRNYSAYVQHKRFHKILSTEGRDRAIVPKNEKRERSMSYCLICKRLFTSQRSLESHIRTHVKVCHFPCPYCCNYSCASTTELVEHVRDTHSSIAVPFNQCLHCSNHLPDMESHLMSHNISHLQCQICLSLMTYESHYKNRRRKHTVKQKHFIKRYMDKYARQRESIRKVNCLLCRSRVRVCHMQSHLHSTHRTFKCDQCSKVLFSIDSLAAHKHNHTLSHNSCPVCNRLFVSHLRLLTHMTKIHQILFSPSRQCTACSTI